MKTFVAALAVSALAVAALNLTAAEARTARPQLSVDGETLRLEVGFGDLDLSTRRGAEVLVRRIQAAAETVCGPAPSSPRALGAALAFRKCVKKTMDAAVRQAPSAEVIAVYRMNWG
jgi:UrcA family protein